MPPPPPPRASLPPLSTSPQLAPPQPPSQPSASPQPASPQPVDPQPVDPQPINPQQPVSPQPRQPQAPAQPRQPVQPQPRSRPQPGAQPQQQSPQPATRAQQPTRAGLAEPQTSSNSAKPLASGQSGGEGGKIPRWRGLVTPASQKSTHEDEPLEPVRRSIPAWLVSMIFHMTLLLALALWTLPVGDGISRVVLEFGEAKESESVELQEYALESADSVFQEDSADSEVEAPVDLEVEAMIESIDIAEPTDIAPLEIGATSSDLVVKPMFGGRTGAMKSALLAMYGGNSDTVEAVDLGLKWLARQQQNNGSWSMRGPYDDGSFQENRTAATAMALLAFQGDGNTHFDGPYAKVVEKGLKYLLNKQSRRDGFFAGGEPDHQRAYAHAQATIALCELYGMTKDSKLRVPSEAAIDYSVRAQGREGGWRYDPRGDSDLSVTGWYVMALSSAQAAGIAVEPSTLAFINGYLDTVAVENGAGYCYQRGRPPSPSMTAEGLLCRQYLGWNRDRQAMSLGLSTLVQDWPINRESMNVYYWYYATQALHHYGGSAWEIWNSNMKVVLPRMQVKRGSEAGSWSPQADEHGNASGRLYTTCFSIYCLEVYYRHLPLYKLGDK
ncbi:terpene cyclase/mutase family protein [Rhodopirellula sp. ICT_H3.1]|uniref:Terpene cyclase/mutase family protein n=1 Tax=Aporhodopirellula aestuarii TaxID=2950107 RepID=A0ABT0U1Q9_9BACT|nr:terpene cyclase/mutase family protein [Aporhodopirellula aestuarii]